MGPDKFNTKELSSLHSDLVRGDFDSWQVAELFQQFIAGHGYGTSHTDALRAVNRVNGASCSLQALHHELEQLALMM